MDPEERMDLEIQLVQDVELFCLKDTTHYQYFTLWARSFHELNVIHSDSLMAWLNSTPAFEIVTETESLHDFRFQNRTWIETLSNNSDLSNYFDFEWCDSTCDCCAFLENNHDVETDSMEQQEWIPRQKIQWAPKITVREFLENQEQMNEYQKCDVELCECC
jgi:hypothetical protein